MYEIGKSNSHGRGASVKSGIYILTAVLLCASMTGCRLYSRHRILSVWADWNTYEQTAFVVDDKNHLPYRGAEVAHFNWMYGKRQYKPLHKPKRREKICEPATVFGMPLYPSGLFNKDGKDAPEEVAPTTPAPIGSPSATPVETAPSGSANAPTADNWLYPFEPIGHEEPADEKFAEEEDGFSFEFYPPSDLNSLDGSRPR